MSVLPIYQEIAVNRIHQQLDENVTEWIAAILAACLQDAGGPKLFSEELRIHGWRSPAVR